LSIPAKLALNAGMGNVHNKPLERTLYTTASRLKTESRGALQVLNEDVQWEDGTQ
jgi:hypothetical protein